MYYSPPYNNVDTHSNCGFEKVYNTDRKKLSKQHATRYDENWKPKQHRKQWKGTQDKFHSKYLREKSPSPERNITLNISQDTGYKC